VTGRAAVLIAPLLISFAISLAGPLAGPLAAQQRAGKPLGKPIAELEEPLTGPVLLVELRDGRVLLHDAGEKRLMVVDFATGEIADVAREGAGPKEFRSALALLRAPSDSVWLYDLLQSRVLVLGPDGVPHRVQLFSDASNPMAMLSRPMVREHDRAGNTYGELRAMSFEGGKISMGDSVVLVRARQGKADSVAKMPMHMSAPEFVPPKIRVKLPGFPPMDAWGVFPDGRIMLIDGDTYTPQLILPDGTRRTAAAIPFPRMPVTAADRVKLMEETRKQFGQGMQRARGMAQGQPIPEFEFVEPNPWQSEKPPLLGTAIKVDDRNRAWVPVRDVAGLGGRFDLLDAEGRLVDTVQLAKEVLLLGFGKGVAYVARKDADDLLHLQKVALP
jgi:hypothetical protein